MRPKVLPLLIPGTVFWTLVILGVATGNTAIWVAAGIVGCITAVGFATIAITTASRKRSVNRRVWAEGIPATARVVSSRTNGSLNDHPYVEMTLEVTTPGHESRTVEVRQAISQIAVSRFQPGGQIAVKVDRDDPTVVVVDEALTPYGY